MVRQNLASWFGIQIPRRKKNISILTGNYCLCQMIILMEIQEYHLAGWLIARIILSGGKACKQSLKRPQHQAAHWDTSGKNHNKQVS